MLRGIAAKTIQTHNIVGCQTIQTHNIVSAVVLWKIAPKTIQTQKIFILDLYSGVMKLDRIKNERIRGKTKVGEISKRVLEGRLKWYDNLDDLVLIL